MNDENEEALGGSAPDPEPVEPIKLLKRIVSETENRTVETSVGSERNLGPAGPNVSDTFPSPDTLPGEDSDQGSGSAAES